MSIKLISPLNKESISTVKDFPKKYIDLMHEQTPKFVNDYEFNGLNYNLDKFIKVDYYHKNRPYRQQGREILFSFLSNSKGKHYLLLSLDSSMKKSIKFLTHNNRIKINGLRANEKYYWKIINDNEESETFSFTTKDYPRVINCGYLKNVRDFGGRMTKYGKRIKQGLVFRGPELCTKPYDDDNEMHHNFSTSSKTLKILRTLIQDGVEIDLRGDAEANYIKSSLLSDKNHKVDYFRELEYGAYEHFLTIDKPEFINSVKHVFELFSNADKKHVYIHCWGGADRTGTTCFLLGAILGMSYTDLIIDYEFTSFSLECRAHYNSPNNNQYVKFYCFYDELLKYADKNKLGRDIENICKHLLINRFGVKTATIDKIKEVFLEK